MPKTFDLSPISYKDIYFRIAGSLIGSHFIVMFGVEVSFFHVLLKPMYWIALAGSFAIAFLLMLLIRLISIRLDRKFSWEQRTIERISLQLLFGVVLPGIAAFLLAAGYFAIRGYNILNTLYLRIDYPVILILILLINIYYLVYYVVTRLQQATTDNVKDIENTNMVFLVNKGTRNVPVPVEDIAYIFREGDYNFLRTFEGEDYVFSSSLDDAEGKTSPANWFRANRQMLVNRKACKNYELLQYNKLELFANPEYKSSIIISQKRSKEFKQWLSQ